MTGFILAAGLGTRLRPLTDRIPKALVTVCGISLLERACSFLAGSGVTRLGVNAHYRADNVFSAAEQLAVRPEFFHERDVIRGTGGALYFARDFLAADAAFCVVNVDIVSTVNLRSLAERFERENCVCALVAAPPRAGGTIRYELASGQYAGTVAERPADPGLASADFIGMAFYRREFLTVLGPDDFSVVPVWRRAREKGLSVRVFIDPAAYWCDIGTPRSLAQAHFDAIDGTAGLSVPETICIDRRACSAYPRSMTEGVRAALGRYVWCESIDITLTARLRRSVVMEGARVGENADIAETIITPWGEIHFGGTL